MADLPFPKHRREAKRPHPKRFKTSARRGARNAKAVENEAAELPDPAPGIFHMVKYAIRIIPTRDTMNFHTREYDSGY